MSILELATYWGCKDKLTIGVQTNELVRTYKSPMPLDKTIFNIKVIKSNGLKSCAGKAYFKHPKLGMHIRLHPALWDNEDELISQRLETFFHEIAHLVAYLTKHDMGHGIHWSYCLMHFGFEPLRCYNGAVFNFRGYKRRDQIRGEEATLAILDDIGGFEV